MKAKAIELRDEGTFIPLLCVDMNPSVEYPAGSTSLDAQRYLLRRCGYPCDGRPNIAITHMRCGLDRCTNDPYQWPGEARTFPVAHKYIIEHWDEFKDGDVVDVQWILGETKVPKVSERVTAPC